MIVTTDIGNILYRDCKAFGIGIVPAGETLTGELTSERIVIHTKKQQPGKYWKKSFAEVNLCVPNLSENEANTIRLNELERKAGKLFDDVVSTYDGMTYRYSIDSIGTEADTALKCHYVNVRILFNVLNVNDMITAVEIDELYYAEPIKTVTTPAAGLTGAEVATILKNAATKRVKNVHGDTYQYEEAEASVTRYKNALTGEYYRETSEPGEVKINFTIGEYDYATKADLQGGKATEKNWERGKYKPIHKCVIGKTKDGVYVVFPKAAINARGSNTDKAVGLAVSAVPLSTGVDGLASEKWFDESEVVVPEG